MISRPQFAKMKKGVRIINCARGGIIDEQALLEALDAGIVAGAAFDVFEEEPPAADHPFLHHPKIIVTPHLGASTIEAQENVAVDVSEEVLHILRGEPFKNAVNMPPVAPDVLKRLQPYFALGEKLGSFVAQMNEQPIKQIAIDFSGELAEVDTSQLVRYIVKGFLSRHFADEVNVVNSLHLAKTRDVQIVRQKSTTTKGFTNLITVSVNTGSEERMVAGTLLNGYGARVVDINRYPVDIAPEGNLLLISHRDRPGIIGRLGTLLGNNDINIATMQVGRREFGGDAIMVLAVDKPVPQSVRDEILQLADIHQVREINLADVPR